MLPSNAISSIAEIGDYLSPDILDDQSTTSLEQGGAGLNDATQGRQVQVWTFWCDDTGIYAAGEGSPTAGTLIIAAANVTFVSGAFDSSMAPTICYMQNGVLYLRWFNTVTHVFQTDAYVGATSGRVSTDDKRSTQEGLSDVIFAYTLAGTLYWRQERDRYTVARAVGPCGPRVLTRLGMTERLRMQFELKKEA